MTDERDPKTPPPGAGAHPGYAVSQLARAFRAAETLPDAVGRERAESRARRWLEVIRGMLTGQLRPGSRQAVAGVPVWATPEVLTGGFATGRLLAGGPLRAHEVELLRHVPAPVGLNERERLNTWFLTDEGLETLREWLRVGCYDVSVPEEGALLVVAWLLGEGRDEEARAILETIGPYVSRLRFYPRPTRAPQPAGDGVHLQTVGRTLELLAAKKGGAEVKRQKETIGVWLPLYDRLVALFLETFDGEPPALEPNDDGELRTGTDGRYRVAGGWPCRRLPDGWLERARRLLADDVRAREEHTLSARPRKPKGSYWRLLERLQRCVEGGGTLPPRDAGVVRLTLARHLASRGLPHSPSWRALREAQARQIDIPDLETMARALSERLRGYPSEGGVEDLGGVLRPLPGSQGASSGADVPVPRCLSRRVVRCLSAPPATLIERGIVTSGDVLALVAPQLTARTRAAGLDDSSLRTLDAALYAAFRRRRSLLLLNLEHQVALGELPWVEPLERRRRRDGSTVAVAAQTLQELTELNVRAFPHAIVPNKLLRELHALSVAAGGELPLVDELAADIFMGTFTAKFAEAAKVAARLLRGTLYATYYGIDTARIEAIHLPAEGQRPPGGIPAFAELCAERAPARGRGWSVAANGMVIEQQQILTTQNLAVLFETCGLAGALAGELEELAQRCFAWIVHRLQLEPPYPRARLITVKNAAYAWRQMLFYLSVSPPPVCSRFTVWADEQLRHQEADFRAQFRPAMLGLAMAMAGQSPFEPEPSPQAQARCFLGWTVGLHWLMPPLTH